MTIHNRYAPPKADVASEAIGLTPAQRAQKARKILLRIPLVFLGGPCLGWAITLPYYRTDVQAYMVVGWIIIVASVFGPLFMLGRAASQLGSSWIKFGLAPILFMPIAPMISWLSLFEMQRSLAAQASQTASEETHSTR